MYRSIETGFWTDPKVRQLSPEEKFLFLYLITNPHTHVAGLSYVPMVVMAHETGLSEKTIRRGIDTLSKSNLAYWDEASEVVWVRKMARYQGRGAKMNAAIEAQLRTLHNCSLIKGFLEE